MQIWRVLPGRRRLAYLPGSCDSPGGRWMAKRMADGSIDVHSTVPLRRRTTYPKKKGRPRQNIEMFSSPMSPRREVPSFQSIERADQVESFCTCSATILPHERPRCQLGKLRILHPACVHARRRIDVDGRPILSARRPPWAYVASRTAGRTGPSASIVTSHRDLGRRTRL